MAGKVRVQVEGRDLTLSNLDKVLYPRVGFTKGEVVDYYRAVAPTLLPHLHRRPLTVKRYPDGVDGEFFFEKNAPRHTPEWIETALLPSPGSTKNRDRVNYVLVDGLPTMVWLANLAALELHVPQWTVTSRGKANGVDLLVFDLDPGEAMDITACCRVALLLHERLSSAGLRGYPKTSGSKGMQLYVPIAPSAGGQTSVYAKALAQELEGDHPDLVVSRMEKRLRRGKVLIDWSQNNPAKTTVAPYSLRAREEPTVSTPLEWSEVENVEDAAQLRFTSDAALARIRDRGDLFAPLLADDRPDLPAPPVATTA